MKKLALFVLAALLLAACGNSEKQLRQRAEELCRYIPDHELLERSKDYLTEDFYAVLDTMFNHLPEFEAMDHEWLYYFVTGNGGTIADYTVTGVELTDKTHAVATISVRQKWEDGSFDESTDIEEHKLYMENVDGVWLMSDFDGHKADCIRHIAINRWEQKLRVGISTFLAEEFGTKYTQGDLCIPVLMIVAEEDCETEIAWVWGDFWVFNYDLVGDTLKCVSGGSHAGLMHIRQTEKGFEVTGFDAVEDGSNYLPSAKRIFGKKYEAFHAINSDAEARERLRAEGLAVYAKKHGLGAALYQDYGWPAKKLPPVD